MSEAGEEPKKQYLCPTCRKAFCDVDTGVCSACRVAFKLPASRVFNVILGDLTPEQGGAAWPAGYGAYINQIISDGGEPDISTLFEEAGVQLGFAVVGCTVGDKVIPLKGKSATEIHNLVAEHAAEDRLIHFIPLTLLTLSGDQTVEKLMGHLTRMFEAAQNKKESAATTAVSRYRERQEVTSAIGDDGEKDRPPSHRGQFRDASLKDKWVSRISSVLEDGIPPDLDIGAHFKQFLRDVSDDKRKLAENSEMPGLTVAL